MFDYQSPLIANFCGNLNDEMIKFFDDTACEEIKCAVGYNINKEELLKALNYDRQQYETGYRDGKADCEIDFQELKKVLDEINGIVCNSYRRKYFGDLDISDVQSLLNEILDITGYQREEPEQDTD